MLNHSCNNFLKSSLVCSRHFKCEIQAVPSLNVSMIITYILKRRNCL
jgi:hypothetical protein